MAPSPKHFSFLFLLVLTSFLQIQARESQFFSKFTRYNNNNNNNSNKNNNVKETTIPNNEVPLHNQDQEPSFTPETHNGYGLYGHGSNQFPPTTTTNEAYYTYDKLPSKTPTEYTGGSYEYKEFGTGYSNNNNYKNQYETTQQGTTGAKFVDTGYTTNNGYETTKHGMSDTRFTDNGRYNYNFNNENYYPSGYKSERGSSEGFGTSRGVNSRNEYNNGGYYGNNENSNEFNTMEEYQNQEEFQENEEEFVP